MWIVAANEEAVYNIDFSHIKVSKFKDMWAVIGVVPGETCMQVILGVYEEKTVAVLMLGRIVESINTGKKVHIMSKGI